MNTRRLVPSLGVLVIVAILVAPSAGILLSGPPAPLNQRLARIIAFLIVSASYAAFLGFIVFLLQRYLLGKSRAMASIAIVVLGPLGGLLAPTAVLLPVTGIRWFCFSTWACSPDVFQFVPHALHVGSMFPLHQMLPSIMALVALLTAVHLLRSKQISGDNAR